MKRLLPLILVVIFSINTTHAIELEFDVLEVEISEGQTARVVPLYQDFDFFYQLATGNIGIADLAREERFITTCGTLWFNAVDIQELEEVESDFLERYEEQAAQIDSEVNQLIADALTDSATLLPSDDLIVCVAPVFTEEVALDGVAIGGSMIILLNHRYTEAEEGLQSVVAHEYHHHARAVDPLTRTSGSVLMEQVITEGMAVMFSSLVYPDLIDDYLDPYIEQEGEIWEIFEPNLRSLDDATNNELMFGLTQDLPPNAGYLLGFRIMEAFIANNPDVSIEEWTSMSGDQIYEASDYSPPE